MLRKLTELLAGLFLLVLAIAPVSSAESERIEVAPGVYFQSADGLVSSRPEARQIPAARSGRIVGGTETTITQWPWQTAIAFSASVASGNGFDRQFCGGTLVTVGFGVLPNLVLWAIRHWEQVKLEDHEWAKESHYRISR